MCFLAGSALCAAGEPRPSPVASPQAAGGGKGVSVEVNGHEPVAEPTGVNVLAPGQAPGADTANLSGSQESQIGAGFKFRFGKGAKPTPSPEPDEDDGE